MKEVYWTIEVVLPNGVIANIILKVMNCLFQIVRSKCL